MLTFVILAIIFIASTIIVHIGREVRGETALKVEYEKFSFK